MVRYRCQNCGFMMPQGENCPRCLGRSAMTGSFTPPDPQSGWAKNFGVGLGYFVAGFKFIYDRPKLFKYIIIPLAIALALFAAMAVGGFMVIGPVLGFLDTEWISWLEWLRHAIYWLSYVLLGLLVILLSLFLTLILSTVINSPFYDFLSEKVEEIYLGRSFEEKWSLDYIKRAIIQPLMESIKLALYQAGVMVLLFVVSILSAGLGTILFALAGPYFAALSIFDFIMARKTYSLAEKRKYLKTHLAFAMGFGTPLYLLPFLTPFAVVGATLGFLASRSK